MNESDYPPYDQRRRTMARLIAASIMGLRNDATGANLPEDCWEQTLQKADATLFILSDFDREEAGQKMVAADRMKRAR